MCGGLSLFPVETTVDVLCLVHMSVFEWVSAAKCKSVSNRMSLSHENIDSEWCVIICKTRHVFACVSHVYLVLFALQTHLQQELLCMDYLCHVFERQDVCPSLECVSIDYAMAKQSLSGPIIGFSFLTRRSGCTEIHIGLQDVKNLLFSHKNGSVCFYQDAPLT